MRTTTLRSRLAVTGAACLLALAGVTACSVGSGSDSAGTSDDGGQSVEEAPADRAEALAPETGAAPGTVGSGDAAVAPALAQLKVVRRASLSVRVEDVDAAAASVRAIAADQGGVVQSETIGTDPVEPTPLPQEQGDTAGSPAGGGTAHPSVGTMTIAVPTDALDATLDRLADIGSVLSRNVSSDDITAQYADTDSRVDSARASVERVRALMSKATKIADIVALEAELSRRQADLEALESQLQALDGRVALAPVTVDLRTPDAPADDGDDTGFLAGLTAGWHAFTTSVTFLLTAVGALLPFALAVALVVVPLVVWWRRRSPRPDTTTSPAPPAAPSA